MAEEEAAIMNRAEEEAVEKDAEEEALLALHFFESALLVHKLSKKKKRKIDHRTLPRSEKRKFRHHEAKHCIDRDYLGIPGDPTTPLSKGKDFYDIFRISRSRFQRIMEDFCNTGDPFYLDTKDCFGHDVPSLEARILMPLKCLAFGVPAKAFSDYFQMSTTFGRVCVRKFWSTMREVYQGEYLRLPTEQDVKGITRLHENVHHGAKGMIGSLDCMHTYWNKCPVAWQGSYKKGTKDLPSIVLEAACDHHMWFWHASYGYAGTLNDINILNLSPLMEGFVNGSFEELENYVTPYKLAGEEFHILYFLVDGIYPSYSRFVKSIREPVGSEERNYSEFQESSRKDIERAFGVLQCKFQAIHRPINLMELKAIAAMVATCLILHNMCVSDRIMEGDVRARYNPANSLEEEEEEIINDSAELKALKAKRKEEKEAKTMICNADDCVQNLLIRKNRFKELNNKEEHGRLCGALMKHMKTKKIKNK